MIEIDALTKACGLLTFRYRSFPAPSFDNVSVALTSPEVERAPGVVATESPRATLPPEPAAAPGLGPGAPAPHSVLREIAALSPPSAAVKSVRPNRAARAAWRAATSPQQPR